MGGREHSQHNNQFRQVLAPYPAIVYVVAIPAMGRIPIPGGRCQLNEHGFERRSVFEDGADRLEFPEILVAESAGAKVAVSDPF